MINLQKLRHLSCICAYCGKVMPINERSIKFVQNQLGHAKSQTTLDVYARNNTDMIGRALEGMNGVLRNE